MNNQQDYNSEVWVEEVLRFCKDSGIFVLTDGTLDPPELVSRYEEAARVGYIVARLRQERERIGFVPLSFSEYVDGLLKVINAPITPVLVWLGLPGLTQPDATSARSFALLARELGMSLRETLAHLRISFASQLETIPIPLLVARHRVDGAVSSQIVACENALNQIETDYDLQSLKELRGIEIEARKVYEDKSAEDQ
jgi:hypothetical protein